MDFHNIFDELDCYGFISLPASQRSVCTVRSAPFYQILFTRAKRPPKKLFVPAAFHLAESTCLEFAVGLVRREALPIDCEPRAIPAEDSWGMNRLCYNFHNRETPE
ncbi:MAG: hypothetical protein ACK2U1_01015, partial [Anaerolineales bacterium]